MMIYATEFCFVAFFLYLCIVIIRQDYMKYKKIYKLINNERDCYDCDYTGNVKDLISPLNKLFTKTFLTEELLSNINKERDNLAYPKFHLVLVFEPFLKGKPILNMYITIEYDNNLTATTTKNYESATYMITRVVNEYLKGLGYPMDNWDITYFLDKLIKEHPEFGKYFEVEIIR